MKLSFKKICMLVVLFIVWLSATDNLHADTLMLGSMQTTSYGYAIPYYYYQNDIFEFIVTRAELGNKGAMYLKEMEFYVWYAYNAVTQPGSPTTYNNYGHDEFLIYIQHTNENTLATPSTSSFYPVKDVTDYQLVYRRTTRLVNLPNNVWDKFVFDNDFVYNGRDNIKICIIGKRNVSYGYPLGYYNYAMFSDVTNMAYYGYGYPGDSYAYAINYRPYTRFIYDQGPEIREIYPGRNYSFLAGKLYSQAGPLDREEIPGFTVHVGNLPSTYPNMKATYTITGPFPSTDVVYRAINPATQGNYLIFNKSNMGADSLVRIDIAKASGLFAWTGLGGDNKSLDFRSASVKTGKYKSEVRIELDSDLPNYKDKSYTAYKEFWVRGPNDIACTEIVSPTTYKSTVYPMENITQGLEIQATVVNYGFNPIDSFYAQATIYKVNFDENTQTIVSKTKIKDSPQKPYLHKFGNEPLLTGQRFGLTENHLGTYLPNDVGYYGIEVKVWLADTNKKDQDITNNVYPRIEDFYLFKTARNIDPEILSVVAPTLNQKFALGRTIVPITRVRNNGVTDIESSDDVSLRISIHGEAIPGSGNYTVKVFENTFVIDVMQANSVDIDLKSINQHATNNPVLGWLANEYGRFRVTSELIWPNGNISPDKRIKYTYFEVIAGLAGTFKVGKNGSYKTITDAVRALYNYGVSDTVTFELTDLNYEEGTLDTNVIERLELNNEKTLELKRTYHPALDFRSRIVGVCDTLEDGQVRIRPITFKPAYEVSKIRGNISINLKSKAGIGVMVGPCDTPAVKEAIVLEATDLQKKKWGQSDGYITFDGGDYKAFKFTLETGDNDFRAPFYFSGVSNCTVKNCIIEDGVKQTRSYQGYLPGVSYTGAVLNWGDDWQSGASALNNYTYSTGILIRTTPPYQFSYGGNGYRFDTVYCNNIEISNNEISKFTYGITSLGLGMVLRDYFLVDVKDSVFNLSLMDLKSDPNLTFQNENLINMGETQERVNTFLINNSQNNRGYIYKKHYEIKSNRTGQILRSFVVVIDSADGGYGRVYNHNNKYINNLIYDIGRAGIYLGYEENTVITGNRIHGINGTVKDPAGNLLDVDCAGILLGGIQRGDKFNGFNNIGLIINNNEISNIKSNITASGISYEQSLLYDRIMGSTFPDRAERTKIYNNIIWGIQSGRPSTHRYGINISLSKKLGDYNLPYYEVEDKQYNIKDIEIANNTIIMNADEFSNSYGEYFGIRMQGIVNTKFLNNAIYLEDKSFNSLRTNLAAVVYYQGAMPSEAGNTFNYNVYYWDTNSIIDAYRFVNTDIKSGTVLDTGYVSEYNKLEQWQNWLKSDYYSVYRNFYNDFSYSNETYPKLRIKKDPIPLNSPLDNRGTILNLIKSDIDGNLRGVGDQKYDIGAEEFNSNRYSLDLELVNFANPATYKASTGPFKDAEYLMIDNIPIRPVVRVRNNGVATLTNRLLQLRVYRENSSINNSNALLHNNNFEDVYYDNEILHNKDNTNFEDVDESILEFTYEKYVTLSPGDDFEIEFDEGDWIPQTYKELNRSNLGYELPIHFTRMENNVTPRYKFVLEAPLTNDEDLLNNTISTTVRYYVKKSNIDLMVTAYNTYNKINIFDNGKYVPLQTVTNMDMVAGRLNLDSLLSGLKTLGIEPISAENESIPFYGVDILDRKAWDYRNIDYTLYRTLIVSDELNIDTIRWRNYDYDIVNRTFRDKNFVRDMKKFFTDNKNEGKLNFIMGNEEFVKDAKSNIPFLSLNVDEKLAFIYDYLHTDLFVGTGKQVDGSDFNFFLTPLYNINKVHNPGSLPIYDDSIYVSVPVSYNGFNMQGILLGRDELIKIQRTGWETHRNKDHEPFGILYRKLDHINGFTSIGHVCDTIKSVVSMYNVPNSRRIITLASSNRESNVILLGFDWRHYGNISSVLRSINDFIRNNDGDIVPVELYGFEANAYNNTVELLWHTSSEINTDRFIVERADYIGNKVGNYANIEEIKATGNSLKNKSYSTIDNSVMPGNSYVYRLKVLDFDGTYSYSEPRIVNLSNIELNIGDITPNPVRDIATVNINLSNSDKVVLEVYNVTGERLLVQEENLSTGSHNINVNVSNLLSGSYIMFIHIGNNTLQMRNFTVVR